MEKLSKLKKRHWSYYEIIYGAEWNELSGRMRFADHAFETPAPIYSLLITKRNMW
jgi:hypothetical protein